MPLELIGRGVERLADHVEHVAEHAVADRHLDAVPEVADDRAAPQTVGRLHADGPAPTLADLLRDLGDDRDRLTLELGVHLEREVDLGQRVGRELDVDDRSGDRDDAPVLELGLRARVGSDGHAVLLVSSSDGVSKRSFVLGVGVDLAVRGAPRRRRRSP